MTNPLPPLDVDALPVLPAGFGLYEAATHVYDLADPAANAPRVQGGVRILPVNCSESFGTWPAEPCLRPEFERQRIATASGTITAGTFPITFEGQTASGIPWNATASQVETALEGLSSVGDVRVTGGPLPATPIDVEFRDPSGDVGLMLITSGGLTGGALGVTVLAGGMRKQGDRPTSDRLFTPIMVWAYDECDPQEPVDDSRALALQTLTLQERLLVESDFAAVLLAEAPAPAAAASLVEGLGVLEEALGVAGYIGTVHASRRWAAQASSLRWTNQSGPVYKTPLGHSWAFGGGYGDVLGDTLVATGPIYLWRYPPIVNTVLDPRTNRLATVAERLVLVGFECFVTAVTIGP